MIISKVRVYSFPRANHMSTHIEIALCAASHTMPTQKAMAVVSRVRYSSRKSSVISRPYSERKSAG